MSETARGIWAALIILVPLLGPIAFWLTRPGQVQANERTS
ncbi:MAG: PLDc N-terminal domain-containing protein [Chloroflexales bacterium]|nr:PLDc N-terminal domain-containing protein [Chloroflexales bacterium]